MRNTGAKKQLFDGDDGRLLCLAADHPYFGYIKGLEETDKVLKPLLPYADALMIAPGTKRHYFPEIDTPVIIRISGCASVLDVMRPPLEQGLAKWLFKQRIGRDFDQVFAKYSKMRDNGKLNGAALAEYESMREMLLEPDTLARERLMMSVSSAKRLGASAVAVSVYLGTRYEDQCLANLAAASAEGEKCGTPVLGVVAVGKRLGSLEQDSDFLTRAGRMLIEHGASLIKTYYCGKGFERVIKACPVPVIVAGGKPRPFYLQKSLLKERGRQPKGADATESTLEMAYEALRSGARGIDFGRRIWQHANPMAIIRALREIVHRNATAREAYEKFRCWAGGKESVRKD